MSLFGTIVLPALLIFAGALMLQVRQFKLFSRSARNLDQIDIPNEIKEIRINELEMLASLEMDFTFKHGLSLTRQERCLGTDNRMREARKWLRFIIGNAVLFQEVARFHMESATEAAAGGGNPLPQKVLDRASKVQFMAIACLAKLAVIYACRTLYPPYIPELADRFQFKGHDLVEWYRRAAIDMLRLAESYYDDITYSRFILQLTGLCDPESAMELNRL